MKSLFVNLGVVLIGLAVFTYTEVWVAEAWVLWESGYSSTDQSSSVQWHIIGAYPSHDACVKQESAICTRRQQLATEDKYWEHIKCYPSWGGHTLSLSRGEKDSYKDVLHEWKCLPNTIDPRK